MATGPSVPGPSNAYIPNWAASGRLATRFSRNPKQFILPPYLKIFLDKAAALILTDTLSCVEPNQLQVVINHNQARLWAESSELHEYIKGSPAALDEIRSGTSPNARYGPGLPSSIYGYQIH